jgi:uncharacterized Zn finger protein (UPF0148 family)
MVQKLYPTIDIYHNGALQIDHCITRGNKHFFFDHRNGTVVCATCNRAKHFKQKSIGRAIDEIVSKREGKYFDKMVEVDQTMEPNHGWKKVWWLEKQHRALKRVLRRLHEKIVTTAAEKNEKPEKKIYPTPPAAS